jgi:hypothetical protein
VAVAAPRPKQRPLWNARAIARLKAGMRLWRADCSLPRPRPEDAHEEVGYLLEIFKALRATTAVAAGDAVVACVA